MESYISLIVLLVLIFAMVAFTVRARRRQAEASAQEDAALQAQADAIHAGSEVMTTSGLYGTVAALNDDESVQLVIADGVEVRWALAALIEVDSLPDRYRDAAEPASKAAVEPSAAAVALDKGPVGHTVRRPNAQSAP